ncbi:MAG: LemA family protein [Blastocatellia bacterium]
MAGLLLAGLPGEGLAQGTAAKEMPQDEVYFSIARRLNAISESPVSAIVSELDGVVELVSVVMEPDGKALVTVRERTPASATFPNKSTRLKFAPPTSGKEWQWVEFEENRRFYPVERLFPYTKNEIDRRRQLADRLWAEVVTSMGRQAQGAEKVLATAQAILKKEFELTKTIGAISEQLGTASKEKDTEAILRSYGELQQNDTALIEFADTNTDLKANDAYLRLFDDYKNNLTVTGRFRKDYAAAVEGYNEALLRLPYALVAYGLGYTKMESAITAE